MPYKASTNSQKNITTNKQVEDGYLLRGNLYDLLLLLLVGSFSIKIVLCHFLLQWF